MTEKQFLRSFEGHAKKMRKVVSYREMIMNLRHPGRMWNEQCPFFKINGSPVNTTRLNPNKKGCYFQINNDGNPICVGDDCYNIDEIYKQTVLFWNDNKFPDLITKMISIIKRLQKQ